MSESTVLTWNVLHRIHAVNWAEPAIGAWPDEAARIASIAEWLARDQAEVICLQEVSGDQLNCLRGQLRGDVHHFVYPRVPSYRAPPPAPYLKDPTEHLVVVVRDGGSRLIDAAAFDTDRGKGYLAVELADQTRVVSTHVTYGDKLARQTAKLAEIAQAARAIICGDFNADRSACSAALGARYACVELAPTHLHTRPRQNPSDKSQDIDHIFVRGCDVLGAEIADSEQRSDHLPVRARLRGK